MTTTETKCTEILKADVDSYTQEQYEQMEKELSEKINNLIEETENKYCVAPTIQKESQDRRVSVFILNKSIHNNPPFPQL